MYYDVNSQEIIVSHLPNELPYGAEIVQNGKIKSIKLKWSDEGFDPNEFSELLRLAKKKGEFTVHMSDNHGVNSYKVKFGPGYFEEFP